jgi:neutral ceramidase
MADLKAGVGRTDISPAPGTPQGGWGAQLHQRGSGTDIPLYATALVLADATKSVAIVEADLIGFDLQKTGTIIDAIEQLTGIPSSHILFSCTHSHSGPNTFRLATISEGLDMALSYMETLPTRVAGAVWQAQQNLRPVRCGAAAGSCDINVNRRLRLADGRIVVGRNWNGPVDPTVRVVRFDDLDENPVATILNYACHPTVVGWQNHLFTPDFPGMAKKVVEQEIGGTCLFLQGAAGGIGPRRGFTGDLKTYRRLGKILGLEASRVAAMIETLPRHEKFTGVLESGTSIALYEDECVEPEPPCLFVRLLMLKLPLQKRPDPVQLEATAVKLTRELSELHNAGSHGGIQQARAMATQARTQADLSRFVYGKTHLDVPIQGIRVGPIALLATPLEAFTEIAQAIIAGSPFVHTLFCGYSNGVLGYLPTREAYGEGGYEVAISLFAPDAAEVLVEQSKVLLQELAAGNAAT